MWRSMRRYQCDGIVGLFRLSFAEFDGALAAQFSTANDATIVVALFANNSKQSFLDVTDVLA
jgi:hypothetical protein